MENENLLFTGEIFREIKWKSNFVLNSLRTHDFFFQISVKPQCGKMKHLFYSH